METRKAYARRVREGWFEKYVQLDRPGLDIGPNDDPLNAVFRRWDLAHGDGDATILTGVPDESFFSIYASHILEHVHDPLAAVREWWRALHPGGWLLIVVPHIELYEGRWGLPSRWNRDHKTYWWPETLPPAAPSHHRALRQLLLEAGLPEPEIRVCNEGHSYHNRTVHPLGEFSIEGYVYKP